VAIVPIELMGNPGHEEEDLWQRVDRSRVRMLRQQVAAHRARRCLSVTTSSSPGKCN